MVKKIKKTIYISYYDNIEVEGVKAFIDFCIKNIDKYRPDVLYFLFASPGGDVSSGITLYNFLKFLSQKVVTHNIGSVDSIGNVIFLAGEERFAMPHSTFLFHHVETSFESETKISIQKIEEIKSGLLHDQQKIAAIISDNSSITKEEMSELFDQGQTKSAEFAKKKGFVHAIKSIKLQKDDILLHFPVFKNDNDKKK